MEGKARGEKEKRNRAVSQWGIDKNNNVSAQFQKLSYERGK